MKEPEPTKQTEAQPAECFGPWMVAKRRERRSKTRTEKNPNPQSNKAGGSRFTPLFQEDEKVEAHSEQVEEVAPESSKQTLAKGVKNQALKDITNVGKTKAKGKSREGILKFAAENLSI